MSSRELLRLSCYKIMFLLGIIDMCAIAVNSITTGLLLIEGAVFCSHPTLIFVTGSIGLGAWCTACMICFILVINRLFDILNSSLVKTYFSGYRTCILLIFPFFYGFYFIFFTPPLVFTSQYQAWFFDPFIFENQSSLYQNPLHTANNIIIVVVTCLLYGYLCIALNNKFRDNYFNKSNRSHKSIFIQSTIICMANLIASIIYVVMQFFPVPDWVIIAGHMGWQLGHGCPAIIYITMNRTIRTSVLRLLGFKKNPKISVQLFATQGYYISNTPFSAHVEHNEIENY
ncbi:hypothetical protein WR25_18499 [Diploscapter pachys]|uniref:7TM GPCR serpentine receptor class x (Srx) domain-containing protein n=1 Tax=Diploscapter pachys TaxID=2018661 RepID=A0A2A2JEF2_9BILA|nr:hypothetical protein WR25_18499 [Diploscapter pachys]